MLQLGVVPVQSRTGLGRNVPAITLEARAPATIDRRRLARRFYETTLHRGEPILELKYVSAFPLVDGSCPVDPYFVFVTIYETCLRIYGLLAAWSLIHEFALCDKLRSPSKSA